METLIECSKCKIKQLPDCFYKNSNKLNGVESRCKLCVLKGKKKNYSEKKKKLKKPALRSKGSIVKNIDQCEFKFINSGSGELDHKIIEQFVRRVVCHQS